MSDLISRQALCDDLREYKVYPVPISSDESEVKGYNDGIDLAISVIAEFPSAEPERIVKVELNPLAEDIIIGNTTYKVGTRVIAECECGTWLRLGYKYCPNCGARLEWK